MHTPKELRDRANEYRKAADQLESAADEADAFESRQSKIDSLFSGSLNGVATKTGKRGRPAGSKAKAKGTGKRGRPAGSKNKPKDGETAVKVKSGKRGRPAGSKNKSKDGEETAVKVKSGKRGRPAGSKNKPKDGEKAGKRGRPAGSKNKPKEGEGKISLGDLILQILKEKKSGLDLAGLVKECLDRGYESKSDSFSNIVYQTVTKLMKKEKQVERTDDRKYRLLKKAA